MRRYLLDTGILVHYTRGSQLYQKIEAAEGLSKPDCLPMISVVTQAEILSFAIQHNWGRNKLDVLEQIRSKIIIIDINSADESLINAYSYIDAFSKGNLPGKIANFSAITMGKNDIWIAAKTKIANATLLTIDNDFNHLNNAFISVVKYTT